MPPEGLGEVELPFPIAEETMAFEVVGDSMLPKYENGDIIVVYRDQRHPLSSFYGEEAAVRLKSGERYLKTIERGKSAQVVNLTSFNAKPISGVKLEWIGEICVTLPRGQIERLRAKASARSRRKVSGHAGQRDGKITREVSGSEASDFANMAAAALATPVYLISDFPKLRLRNFRFSEIMDASGRLTRGSANHPACNISSS